MNWDGDAYRMDRDMRLREWLLGNEDAVRVCVQTSHIAEVWDDLKDKDREPTDREVAHAFESMMIRLQTNPFYLQNHAMLTSVIVLAINAWHDSEELRAGDVERRMQAFFLRNLGIEIAMMCAFLVGGYDHLRKVSLEMREFFRHERFSDWDNEHAH